MGCITREQYVKSGMNDQVYTESCFIFTLRESDYPQKSLDVVNYLESESIPYVTYNYQGDRLKSKCFVVRKLGNWKEIKKYFGESMSNQYSKRCMFILAKNDTDGARGTMIEII